MGCRPVGRERQDAGHTARSCFVWPRVSTKSGVAPTNFISLAGHNLAASWKTGFRPNVSSRLSRVERSDSNPILLHNWSIETIIKERTNMIRISVIVGSTRQAGFLKNRRINGFFSSFISERGLKRSFSISATSQCLSSTSPCRPLCRGRPLYEHDVVKKWTAQIAASDGFVFVTPEYNYGPSAVLKNAIDWVYPEWNRKAAAFVSYGSAMRARGIQQVRETMIEVRIAPVRSSVHIPVVTLWAHFQGGDVDKGLAELEKQAQTMIDDLLWWTAALRAARKP